MADRKPPKGRKPTPDIDLDLALDEPPPSSEAHAWGALQEDPAEDDETLNVNFDLELEEPPEAPGSGPAAEGYHSLRDELERSNPPRALSSSPPPRPNAPPSNPPRSNAPRSNPPRSDALRSNAPPSNPPRDPPSAPPPAPQRPIARASSRILEPHGPNAPTLPTSAPPRRQELLRSKPRRPKALLIAAVGVVAVSLGLVLGGGALWLGWWMLASEETEVSQQPVEPTEPAEPTEPETPRLQEGIPVERGLRNSSGRPSPRPSRPSPPPSE